MVDVAPVLAAWAGTGLAVVMVLASGLHVRRREPQAIVVNAAVFRRGGGRGLGPVRCVHLLMRITRFGATGGIGRLTVDELIHHALEALGLSASRAPA